MVLGISFDGVEENQAFAEKYDFGYRLLSDGDRAVGLDYGAAQTAEDGYARRISYLIGPDGRIEKCYPRVDPATHARQVLDDLRELRRRPA